MMFGIGPNELLAIAKERMRVAHAKQTKWLAREHANQLKWEEDRRSRLSCLNSFRSDLDDQIVRAVAWRVLSGQSVTLVQLKELVPNLESLDTVHGLVANEILELDDSGERIQGVGGITLVTTPWRMHLWAPVYARSLKLGLGWFRILTENGRIEGHCPRCKRRLVLSIFQGKLHKVRPSRHGTGCLIDFLIDPSPSVSPES